MQYLREDGSAAVRNNLFEIDLALFEQCKNEPLTANNAMRKVVWSLANLGADAEVKAKFSAKFKVYVEINLCHAIECGHQISIFSTLFVI